MYQKTRRNHSGFRRNSNNSGQGGGNSSRNFRSRSGGGSWGRGRSRGGNRGGGNLKPKFFNPSMLIQKAVAPKQEEYVPKHVFTDFELDEKLKQNIQARGFQKPTPIQDQVIPLLLKKQDVIGMANTGTGKTVAFLLPLINKIYQDRKEKALIIAPTRELALQIDAEFKVFARQMQLYSVTCIGGVSAGGQIRELRRNPNFVIGTPGRLKDLDQRRILRFSDYSNIVLDEVDRMLDMGFLPEVKQIIARLPRQRQSLFFSATMSDKMRSLTQGFLNNPVSVSVHSGNTSVNVDQDVIKVAGREKTELLHELLIKEEFKKVLIFGRTKHGIEKLMKKLRERGFRAASIHGNKSQNQRQRALADFKENRIKILLATDIASRGLHIDRVTHVINYDMPESYEDYVHRIGRTGRIDQKGVALTFVD